MCHKPEVKIIPLGPWYCFECKSTIGKYDTVDPTLDFPMIDYLKKGIIPDEYEDQDKIAL